MEIWNNGFSGPLPEKIFHSLHKLLHLDLDWNSFDGHLPENLFAYTPVLHKLYLGDNLFCGSLPEEIFYHTPKLTFLKFSQNEFEGHLPEKIFANLPNLRTLYFYGNWFGPSLPKNVFNAQSKLLVLHLNGNEFEGELPSFSNLVQLQQLDFQWNNFASVPPMTFHTNAYGRGMGIVPSPLKTLLTRQRSYNAPNSDSLNWGGRGGLFDIWVPNRGTETSDADSESTSYALMNATQILAFKNTQNENFVVNPDSPGTWLSPKHYNLQTEEVSLSRFETDLHFFFDDHLSLSEKCQQLGFPHITPACDSLCVADCHKKSYYDTVDAMCVGFTDLARVGDGICDNGITNELLNKDDTVPPNFNCYIFDDDLGDCSDTCISDCDGTL